MTSHATGVAVAESSMMSRHSRASAELAHPPFWWSHGACCTLHAPAICSATFFSYPMLTESPITRQLGSAGSRPLAFEPGVSAAPSRQQPPPADVQPCPVGLYCAAQQSRSAGHAISAMVALSSSRHIVRLSAESDGSTRVASRNAKLCTFAVPSTASSRAVAAPRVARARIVDFISPLGDSVDQARWQALPHQGDLKNHQ